MMVKQNTSCSYDDTLFKFTMVVACRRLMLFSIGCNNKSSPLIRIVKIHSSFLLPDAIFGLKKIKVYPTILRDIKN